MRNSSQQVEFVNLGLAAGLASECSYDYQWHPFDNDTGTLTALGETGTAFQATVALPTDRAPFLMVRITSSCLGQPTWASAVNVYLRNGDAPSVVGIERADPPR